MSGYLYRFEARGIQSYILGHRKLKRLLGASAIVRELVEVELPKVLDQIKRTHGLKCERLMSAAGMSTVRFPNPSTLKAFLRVWPYLVAARAPGLRTVQAWVLEELGHEELERRLEVARCTPPIDLPAGSPVMDRSRFRKLPAEPEPVKNEEGELEIVDAAARRAMDKNVELEKVIYTGPDGEELPRPSRSFPRDLNEMTDGRYIAIIHADGNGIGDWFREDITFETRQDRSERLKKYSLSALRTAISTIDVAESRYLLGVPILFGGDDLVMLVRADKAIAFIQAYTAAFEERFARENADRKRTNPKAKPICISAGIAFVRPNHAFHLAHRLASDLGKRAKNVSRLHSSVWFHRFTDLLADKPPRSLCPIRFEGKTLQAAIDVAERLKKRDIARGPIRSMLTAVESHDPSSRTASTPKGDGHAIEAQAIWDRFCEVHAPRLGDGFKTLTALLNTVHAGLAKSPFVEDAQRANHLKVFSPWADINTLAVVQEATTRGKS